MTLQKQQLLGQYDRHLALRCCRAFGSELNQLLLVSYLKLQAKSPSPEDSALAAKSRPKIHGRPRPHYSGNCLGPCSGPFFFDVGGALFYGPAHKAYLGF